MTAVRPGAGPPLAPSDYACPTCNQRASGRYCCACGERRPATGPPTLRHYFDVAADLLTNFDSKGFRSLWYLVARPGFLSVEQLRGSRVRYAKPLSLFISINVVYYISISIFGANTFTTPLAVQMNGNDYYGAFAAQNVTRAVEASGRDYATFERSFNDRTNVLSKTLIFLFIPLYAVLFYGFFHRQRPYIVEHAVVATHLWTFILMVLAVVIPGIAWLLMWRYSLPSTAAALQANDGPVSLFLQVVVAGYLALMLRRVYDAPWAYGTAVALLIAWAFFHIVWLYRFVLFEITLHTIQP